MTKKKKEPELKEFFVTFSITGKGSCLVMAENEQDARENFFNLEPFNDDIDEWSFDEVLTVEPNE